MQRSLAGQALVPSDDGVVFPALPCPSMAQSLVQGSATVGKGRSQQRAEGIPVLVLPSRSRWSWAGARVWLWFRTVGPVVLVTTICLASVEGWGHTSSEEGSSGGTPGAAQ